MSTQARSLARVGIRVCQKIRVIWKRCPPARELSFSGLSMLCLAPSPYGVCLWSPGSPLIRVEIDASLIDLSAHYLKKPEKHKQKISQDGCIAPALGHHGFRVARVHRQQGMRLTAACACHKTQPHNPTTTPQQPPQFLEPFLIHLITIDLSLSGRRVVGAPRGRSERSQDQAIRRLQDKRREGRSCVLLVLPLFPIPFI